MNKRNSFMGVIKAARLHLSILKLTCICLGIAIAYNISGQINIIGICLALTIGFFSHGASSISNEWADAAIDASQDNRTFISGGSGSASKGLVNRGALAGGWIISTILTICTAVIAYTIFKFHFLIIVLTIIGLVLALGYSLPPLKFSRRGMGELAVLIAYSIPIFFGTIILQLDNSWISLMLKSFKPYLFTIPPALAIFTLLSLTQIPDIETDKKAGKISIAIMLRAKNVLIFSGVILILCAICFISFALLDMLHFSFAAAATVFPIITSIIIFKNLDSVDKPKPEMMKSLVRIFKITANTAMLCSIIPAVGLFIFPISMI